MKLFVFVITTLSYVIGFAGTNRVGNGGDVFVCHNQEIKLSKKKIKKNQTIITADLLDFMESELKIVDYSGDYRSILTQVVENLRTVAPQLANQYQNRIKSIENEVYFQSHTLKDIEDSSEWIEKKNCKLIQAAIRKNEISYGEKRFIIQKDLWEKMDERNKAGLIMHEIVYEHFYKLGEVNSVKARKVNALLFSSELAQMSTQKFYHNLQKMDLPIYQR